MILRTIILTILLSALLSSPGLIKNTHAKISPPSKKAACTNFRLDQEGFSLHGVPVLNQGNTGTCYAHAAATIRSAVENINGRIASPNPIELSMASSYTGGDTCHAFNVTEEAGWCEASRLDTDTINRFASFHERYSVLRENVESLRDNRSKGTKLWDSAIEWSLGIRMNRTDAATIEKYEKTLDDIRSKLAKEVREQIDLVHCTPQQFDEQELLNQIDSALKVTDEIEFIEQIKGVCTLTKPIGDHPSKCENITDVIPALEEQFKNVDSKTLPVEIGYCVNEVFGNKNDYSIGSMIWYAMKSTPDEVFSTSYVSQENREKYNERCGNHASVIMGRQFNNETGKCQYMIQNSWGTDCSYYPDHLKCEDGKYWIDEDLLKTSALNVNIVRPSEK